MEKIMKNITKSMIALLLSLVFIISSFLPVIAVDSERSITYSKTSNSGQRDVICTSLDGTSAGSYYTGNYEYDKLDDYTGNTLYNQLQTLMRSTHSYISSYNDCHYKADKVDCENNDGKVLLIYTSYSATMSQWNGWNREHVWPKSLGGNSTTNGGADLHHIRPSDATVNSTRGNKKYGNASGGSSVYGNNPASGYLGGYSGTYYEPLDNVKGDVARICLYVYVRWGSDWGATSITKVFQSIDVLLEWCALDPVDTWEMGRNEVVQGIQGNRNVFIDYPELAWLLFDREIPDDMVTPSGIASNGNSGSGDGGDIGGDESCTHANTEIRNSSAATCTDNGYTGDTYCTDCEGKVKNGSVILATGHKNTEVIGASSATCAKDGYTGDTYCNDCDEIVSEGSIIPANDNHSFGEWTSKDDNHSHERVCSVCGRIEILDLEGILSFANSDAERILILLVLGISDSFVLEGISE